MKFFSRIVKSTFLAWACGSVALLATNANAIPIGDAYETGQAEFQVSPEFNPRNEAVSGKSYRVKYARIATKTVAIPSRIKLNTESA